MNQQFVSLLVIASMQPLFTSEELRVLPCGWHRTTSDTVRTDARSSAAISGKVLRVQIRGSEGPRTAFVIVDGEEERIDAIGPLDIRRFVTRHRKHKVVFGTIIHDRIWYGEAACLHS